MRTTILLFVLFLFTALTLPAEDKGRCPDPPPKPTHVPPSKQSSGKPPSPDAQFAGTVSVMAVVSDKGYVCSADPVNGPDKETNMKIARAVQTWRFKPAKKNGQPVPVVVMVSVALWRKPNGELILPTDPNQPQSESKPATEH
jgi:hypothetical protein